MIRKLDTEVEFPETLNLDSFCDRQERDAEDIKTFELFGLVEQSGNMNWGHYVAHTKRVKTSVDEPTVEAAQEVTEELEQLAIVDGTSGSTEDIEQKDEENVATTAEEMPGSSKYLTACSPPPESKASWYTISDSHAQIISRGANDFPVRNVQAYILFYRQKSSSSSVRSSSINCNGFNYCPIEDELE